MQQFSAPDLHACFTCLAISPTLEASWCLCVTAQRTLVCLHCDACFCRAPKQWKDEFWRAAPATPHTGARTTAGSELPRWTALPVRPLIVLVDDDRIIHKIVGTVLQGHRGTLVHVEDGVTALAVARRLRPELVITDALMPHLDGRELARQLKGGDETRDGKVVVMTALYKGRRYQQEALRDFLVDEYLEKPVAPAKLAALAADASVKAAAAMRSNSHAVAS